MSRNPHKTRCQVPGCRNWAMRGHTHCRPHLDPELGSRGAGAPPGNLNALRTGDHTHPLSPGDLDQLVHDVRRAPDQLPHHLATTIRSIHRRCQDPIKTLLALQALVPALLSHLADDTFTAELHDLLAQIPEARRGQFERSVWSHALQLPPVEKLELIRALQHRAHPLAKTVGTAAPPSAPGPLDSTADPMYRG